MMIPFFLTAILNSAVTLDTIVTQTLLVKTNECFVVRDLQVAITGVGFSPIVVSFPQGIECSGTDRLGNVWIMSGKLYCLSPSGEKKTVADFRMDEADTLFIHPRGDILSLNPPPAKWYHGTGIAPIPVRISHPLCVTPSGAVMAISGKDLVRITRVKSTVDVILYPLPKKLHIGTGDFLGSVSESVHVAGLTQERKVAWIHTSGAVSYTTLPSALSGDSVLQWVVAAGSVYCIVENMQSQKCKLIRMTPKKKPIVLQLGIRKNAEVGLSANDRRIVVLMNNFIRHYTHGLEEIARVVNR